MKSRTVFGSIAIVLLCCARFAPAAQIGLSVTQSSPVIISGGSANIKATVTNTDIFLSNTMDFGIQYADASRKFNNTGSVDSGEFQSFQYNYISEVAHTSLGLTPIR